MIQDIMPFTSPEGGRTVVESYTLNTVAFSDDDGGLEGPFNQGEVLSVDADTPAGSVLVIPVGTNPVTSFNCIAAVGSAGLIRSFVNTTVTTGITVPVYPLLKDQTFITKHVYDGTDTAVAIPPVGTQCSFWRTSGSNKTRKFGLDTTGVGLTIVRVLDSRKRDTYLPGANTTGTYAVFRVTAL